MNVWQTYRPSDSQPWDIRRVVHLHRRAGFAANWLTIQRDLAHGPRAAVDRLINPPVDHEFQSMADTIGDAAMASGNLARLQAWWFYRMLFSPDPLGERLTLMWHNHFATSNRKVDDLVLMRDQNETFRRHARAPFSELLIAAVKHPAMLIWLDADSNRKGNPNENLAREMMELFTLGLGNFAEQDVKEAARALTGWSLANQEFKFLPARHDDRPKHLFGATESLDGDALVDKLIEHPATARRIAWRICQTFMGEGVVDDAALDSLADGLRSNQLSVGWAVETVLRSELFFFDANIHSRVLGPSEFIVGTLKALELCEPPPSTLLLVEWADRMGQELFYPPNVGGWTEGRSWLGSRTIVARANFADSIVNGQLWRPTRRVDVETLLRRHNQQTDATSTNRWLAILLLGDASLGDVSQTAKSAKDSLVQVLTRPESLLG